jgi:hypothetical protein
VREAGKLLEADYILEGSVQHAGQQLRINAQFVGVRDDLPLWSGKFDREFARPLRHSGRDFQRDRQRLAIEARVRPRYETSTEAYDLCLRAAPRLFPMATS